MLPEFVVLSCRVVERVDWLLYFSHDDQALFSLLLKTRSTEVGEGDWCVLTTEFAHILPRHPVNGQTVFFLGHRNESVFPDTLSASSSDSINDRITSGSVVNVRGVVKVGDVTFCAVMSREPAQSTHMAGEGRKCHFVCFVFCFVFCLLCVFVCNLLSFTTVLNYQFFLFPSNRKRLGLNQGYVLFFFCFIFLLIITTASVFFFSFFIRFP